MPNNQCPKCRSGDLEQRMVNDRFRAADPSGEPFELALKLLMWNCRACGLSWQGQEALAAKEAAYQNALLKRPPSRTTSYVDPGSGQFGNF